MGDNSKQLPKRIKLLNWGVNDSTEGPVIVNDLTVSTFNSWQRKYGRERAPLDYEHNTVEGTPEYNRTFEPRPIAAMGTPVVIPGEGVFLDQLTYTATGETLSNFEDVSAAPMLNRDRVVVGLHSAAATRTGAVYDALFKQATLASVFKGTGIDISEMERDGIFIATCSSKLSVSTKNNTKTPMPEKFISLATLNSVVGLAPEADEAAFVKALKQRLATDEIATLSALVKDGKVVIVDTVDHIEKRLKTLEDAGTKQIATLSATIDGKVHTFSAEDIAGLAARVDKLVQAGKDSAASYDQMRKNEILPLFAREGRVPKKADGTAYNADELKALDLPTLQLLHANTPVTVPLNARRPAGEKRDDSLKGAARAGAAWGDLK